MTGSIVIDDVMAPDIEYLRSSSRPPALESGDTLKWGLPIIPRTGITISYSIRPQRAGRLATNLFAAAHLRADGGIEQHFDFPVPEIFVVTPSPTPTSTPTPTPTATPTPLPLYLPLLVREYCDPSTLANDVAIVLDASTSMLATIPDGRTQMQAARDAIELFLATLDLDNGPAGGAAEDDREAIDRASIIAFNSQATLVHALSADRRSLEASLSGIRNAPNTRIDLGLQLATQELSKPDRRPDAGRVIILLTDGRSNPVPISVAEERAAEARAAGISIFTIGLGARGRSGCPCAYRGRSSHDFSQPQALSNWMRFTARLRPPCPASRSSFGRGVSACEIQKKLQVTSNLRSEIREL